MLIIDWMKTDVVSISPDTTLLHCKKLFKEHQISRLPVIDTDGVVVGMLTLADLNTLTPKSATPLEMIEMLEVLREAKAKSYMIVAPPTISSKSTVDQAALHMIEHDISYLPVVDDDFKLVGILTEWDMLKALADATGAAHRGVDVAFVLEDARGTLRTIIDQLTDEGMRIISVQTSYSGDGLKRVKVRFHSEDQAAEGASLQRLKQHPRLRYWARGDDVGFAEENAG